MSVIIHSLTASHIDSKARPNLFLKMLDSLVANKIQFINVSMSFHSKFSLEEKDMIIKYLNKKINQVKTNNPESEINIYYHFDKGMTQFEHLQYLFDINENINSKYTLENNHYVLFMDDDDLLLRLPKRLSQHSIIVGMQYCPASSSSYDKTENMTREEILKIEPEYKDIWKVWDDFSGYMCKIKYIVNYFTRLRHLALVNLDKMKIEKHEKSARCEALFNSLEDIDFMDYLDKMNSYKPEPFIFHRIWSADDLPYKTWRQRLVSNQIS